jgi:hypothetical protein
MVCAFFVRMHDILWSLVCWDLDPYAYITDCLRDHAPEAFASLNLANLYEFG